MGVGDGEAFPRSINPSAPLAQISAEKRRGFHVGVNYLFGKRPGYPPPGNTRLCGCDGRRLLRPASWTCPADSRGSRMYSKAFFGRTRVGAAERRGDTRQYLALWDTRAKPDSYRTCTYLVRLHKRRQGNRTEIPNKLQRIAESMGGAVHCGSLLILEVYQSGLLDSGS